MDNKMKKLDMQKKINNNDTNNKNPMSIQYKGTDKYVDKLSDVDAEILAKALRTIFNK